MDAEIVAVGSELIRFSRRDSNSEWLIERLNRLGVEVRARTIVEDDAARIASAVASACGRADLVLLTGGLGPTEDDRTREGLSIALELPLERDPGMLRVLEQRYAAYGYRFTEDQARQADRPRGMRWLDNPVGSAPGLLLERPGTTIAALPGVPGEMRAIFESALVERLGAATDRVLARRTLKIAGRTESGVDRAVRALYGRAGTEVTILTRRGEIELNIRAVGENRGEVERRLNELDRSISERLGHDVFGRDGETLEGRVGELLLDSGKTLATAESCTAGMLAARVTRVAGASRWFRGGLVVYDDTLKQSLAGVQARTLRAHGAVSEAVARELAAGARARCLADVGLGITGIAGPGGGTPEKPTGLVHLAIEDAAGSEVWKLNVPGDRSLVRSRAVASALDRLRRHLAKTAERARS